MLIRLSPFLIATAFVVCFMSAACSSGAAHKYPVTFKDDQYDLEKMTLTESDVPEGFSQKQSSTFDNEAWAAIVGADDPEAKKNQLDSLGRINSAAKIFSWDNPIEHLGQTYQITSQATLYVSVDAATKSMKLLCDLPIEEKNQSTELKVPLLGDQVTGLVVSESLANFGVSKDSIVCVRTGRIVNAVVESGLDGTQNIGRTVALARKALVHADATLK